jgi:diaminohydroxyphosphoribosylaminopyrimidine deaminase/5-amino-6-(5-phosphoribosylamino)uracil reductase
MNKIQKIENHKFISLAINLSRKNLGLTSPNPAVGCVIVKNDVILATGITSSDCGNHAEKNAIENALAKNINLENATAYISLEPCCHYGKNPPCVDLFINYKFKKVVFAVKDPDKRMNGKSIKILQKNNIEVEWGILEKQAKQINRGFFKVKQVQKPFVILKLAMSLDGKVAYKNYSSKWITSQNDRKMGHLLRAQNDAILIGANTARYDFPKLNCRILGLERYSPKVIIMANNLDDKLKQYLLGRSDEVYVATNNDNFKDIKNIIVVKYDDIDDLLKKLPEFNINNLLVEGGGKIATEFIKSNNVDELKIFRGKKIIGSDGIDGIGSLNYH